MCVICHGILLECFPEGLKFICESIGMSYYHDFEEDVPESFKILKMIDDMNSNSLEEKERPFYYEEYGNYDKVLTIVHEKIEKTLKKFDITEV